MQKLLRALGPRVISAAVLASAAQGCPQPTPSQDVVQDTRGDATEDAVCVVPNLAAPPPGQGIQLRVELPVPAGTEQQKCWYFRLPSATSDLEIVRYEVQYNRGSHHMNLFRMLPSVEASATTAPRTDVPLTAQGVDCFQAVDFNSYDLVVGSQDGAMDWHLPPGVAYRLHANSAMILQSHFVNAATQDTPCDRGVVYVNLWTAMDPSAITAHLGTMFANNRNINLPPHQDSSFSANCTLPSGGTVVAMTGHFHSRGRQFTVFESPNGVDPGNQCYQSSDWTEPPFVLLDPSLSIPSGGGLSYTCSFFNDTDFPITFGPHVEYEEHCNLFAYFYATGLDPNSRARYCF